MRIKPSTTLDKLALTICMALGASYASASVIYDGGSPNLFSISYADTSYSYTTDAENFILQPGSATITDAHWWGGCYISNLTTCPGGDFTIAFYSDATGAPGNIIQQYSVGNANQTATGNLIDNRITEYSYSANFSPLDLVAGTVYWFAVSNTTNGDRWGMETSSTSGNHAQFLTGSGWTTQSMNLAFNLTNDGTVPEPASLALFGLGLAGMVVSRRRTQSRS